MGGEVVLAFLQDRPDFLDRPAVADGDLGAAVHEHVGADLVVGRYDGQIGLRLPVQRKVEVAREDLPA
jgi:hypothetical protein